MANIRIMKRLLPSIYLIFFLSFPGRAGAQQFIGEHKSDVRRMMKESMRELYEDDASRNMVYNMIKYVDNTGNQTLIYFFSDEDTCLYSKWMCDYSMMNKVVSELNEKFKQSSEDTWYYSYKGKDYKITLTTGEWFFTIATKPDKKD